jgi:hypothetical protein
MLLARLEYPRNLVRTEPEGRQIIAISRGSPFPASGAIGYFTG